MIDTHEDKKIQEWSIMGKIVQGRLTLTFLNMMEMIPSGWLCQANQFFFFHKTPYNQKVCFLFSHMEDRALM
jgi:ABC-type arginine transport system ATPase subunit